MMKLIAGLTMMLSVAAFSPQPAAAADCTAEYTKCLNDTYELDGWLQVMADVECGADYAACIMKKFTD